MDFRKPLSALLAAAMLTALLPAPALAAEDIPDAPPEAVAEAASSDPVPSEAEDSTAPEDTPDTLPAEDSEPSESSVPADVPAEPAAVTSGTCGENLSWSSSSDGTTLIITGTGAMYDYNWLQNNAPWYNLQDSFSAITLNSGITAIGSSAFWYFSKVTELTIPSGVTSIGNNALQNMSSLRNLVIPATVTRIGNNCLSGSDTPLTIVYDGTKAQWDAISVGSGNPRLSNATVIFAEQQIVITAQPADKAVKAAKTAKFTVTAEGSNLAYQWQYKSPNGTAWASTTLTGNKTATLSVSAAAGRDGYSYRCRITDDAGTIVYSEPATLRVLAVTSQPKDTTAAIGKTAKFTVAASGDVLSYQWQYKAPAGTSWASTTLTGNKTAALSVSALAGRDGYSYRCRITDTAGNIVYSEPAVLTVAASVISVTGQPSEQNVKAGNTAKFTVTAEGSGLSYQWQYKAPTGTSWASTTLTGNKTATLSVSATTGRDGYSYRCKITDAAGTIVYSEPAVLRVLAVTSQPADVKADADTSVRFSVTACGNGITYQWQYRSPAAAKWASTTLVGNKTASLTVPATAGRDGYSYRCRITDTAGNIVYSEPAVLSVIRPTITILSQPADLIASEGVVAQFSVTAAGSGLTYQWQHMASSGIAWVNSSLTGCKTSALTVSVTASLNGYQYRCKVMDAAGSIAYSEPAVLTVYVPVTPEPEPPAGTVVTAEARYSWAFRVLDLVNQERAANGLPALKMDTAMLDAAMLRAAECVVSYGHTRPNGESCFTAFPNNGWHNVGENIAYNYTSPEAVVTGWMNSSGHRANILNANFTNIGIGCVVNGREISWSQCFSNGRTTEAVSSSYSDSIRTWNVETR